MMFAHLKRPVAVNLLNNFKATLASYHLYCMFAVSKLNHHATLHATLAVSKYFILHIIVVKRIIS